MFFFKRDTGLVDDIIHSTGMRDGSRVRLASAETYQAALSAAKRELRKEEEAERRNEQSDNPK